MGHPFKSLTPGLDSSQCCCWGEACVWLASDPLVAEGSSFIDEWTTGTSFSLFPLKFCYIYVYLLYGCTSARVCTYHSFHVSIWRQLVGSRALFHRWISGDQALHSSGMARQWVPLPHDPSCQSSSCPLISFLASFPQACQVYSVCEEPWASEMWTVWILWILDALLRVKMRVSRKLPWHTARAIRECALV